jgi:predicted membrane-bound mannosyltransferase
LKALALVIILTATSVGVAQSVSLNFYNYDKNDEYPYVYAHTYREFLDLVKEFEKYANKVNKDELSVVVVSEDYWPLPWYTRDYKGVGYYGKIVPAGDAQIVIGSETQKPNLNEMLADKFTLVGEYPLRPGVTLLLYVRNDLMR